jgi:VIT1/CCC1 family predicted Fe2+/Mn2+ transporter
LSQRPRSGTTLAPKADVLSTVPFRRDFLYGGLARLVVKMNRPQKETHFVQRLGWLRAAVLGANDGIISTASLIVGVASAAAQAESILVAGVAGLVGGAMSMAAGEYVSVSSQSDTERADLAREKQELKQDPASERELAALGVIGARVGGAGILRPTIRVMFWGALAMAVTAGIGAALGTVV